MTDIWYWIIPFIVFAALVLILIKVVLSNNQVKKNAKLGIDAIIGERCIVTEKIDNFAGCGQARVNGQDWSARGAGEFDSFEVGEVLNVVAIEGVKLICKR